MSVETPATCTPQGCHKELKVQLGSTNRICNVEADWMLLRELDKPVAEMFYVAYTLKSKKPRPLTFVFNGGPGAASAYLHVGALGPQRVDFCKDGSCPPPPSKLVENKESWLAFTDLVFVDPIGTGFSRTIDKETEDKEKSKKEDESFWALNRDLKSLGEFANKFLCVNGRWDSPIFVAGESYGGFRAAKLTKLLQEGFGIGLNGSVLISPALEIGELTGSDYDINHWIGSFPSMVATAHAHGVCRGLSKKASIAKVLEAAEAFAAHKLAPWLVIGNALPAKERAATSESMADLLGLQTSDIAKRNGRVDIRTFSRLLLKEKGEVCGLYDANLSAPDPFPDRAEFQGPDVTLSSIERVFSGGINSHLRKGLGLATSRDYRLLNYDVYTKWKVDAERHVFEAPVGATDDLRYGMALNPHTKVLLVHGVYDLVTPYYVSKRIADLMKLDPKTAKNLTVESYAGGHMFYTREESRKQFTKSAAQFYKSATS